MEDCVQEALLEDRKKFAEQLAKEEAAASAGDSGVEDASRNNGEDASHNRDVDALDAFMSDVAVQLEEGKVDFIVICYCT